MREYICFILRRNLLNVEGRSLGGYKFLMKLINYINVISFELYCGFSVLLLSFYYDDYVRVI